MPTETSCQGALQAHSRLTPWAHSMGEDFYIAGDDADDKKSQLCKNLQDAASALPR